MVSTIGDQMQQVAIGWQLYLLTDSPVQLGLVSAVRGVPLIALSLMGGALADIMDRRRLLWVTNLVQATATCVLVAATLSGRITPALIYTIAFAQGGASAFDAPTRQAMIPNIVPRNELTNAFTLNQLLRQTSLVVGPGLGGLVIAYFGLAWTYVANAMSFLAVVAAVTLMKPMPVPPSIQASLWDRLVGGWRFAQHQPLVLLPLMLDAWRSILIGTSVFTIVFARDVFQAGPEAVGVLRTAMAAGAVAGGIALGTGRFSGRPVRTMVIGYVFEGTFIVILGASPVFLIAVAALFCEGIASVTAEVMRNTIVQLKTPDEVRGRVSALGQMFTTGGPQLGQLQAGALVSAIGPAGAAVGNGLAIALGAVIFGLLPAMRRGDREPLGISN